ncbi:MAG: helix-turn-helix transcriptional regulator [Clostridia bacterium]|nr:helix-turn-helix transcriptional regulator [Clostridia bacterium]MBR0387777.1 helix-turn-helix transcriptional regulator [Clostridia bacterium]
MANQTPFYSHYYAEMLLVQEGMPHLTLDQEELDLRPGEVVMICPRVRHRISVADDERFHMIVLRMDPDRIPSFPDYAPGLKSILAEVRRAQAPMRIPAEEVKKIGLPSLFTQILQEIKERRYGYDMGITSCLGILCLLMVRFWMAHGVVLPSRETQVDPIYSLSAYIQSHLREGLRVEDLAEYCGLSYPWFAKKFRDIYGISCKDYIEQIRVARVEQFLLFTDLDLAEISEVNGYADCSHMIKNFKRLMGITPGQYRLQQR